MLGVAFASITLQILAFDELNMQLLKQPHCSFKEQLFFVTLSETLRDHCLTIWNIAVTMVNLVVCYY